MIDYVASQPPIRAPFAQKKVIWQGTHLELGNRYGMNELYIILIIIWAKKNSSLVFFLVGAIYKRMGFDKW
jgi:hypothetical protein